MTVNITELNKGTITYIQNERIRKCKMNNERMHKNIYTYTHGKQNGDSAKSIISRVSE